MGISEWDTTNYGPRPALHEFNRLIRMTGVTKVPFAQMAHGDMIQVSWERTDPVHVGILEVDDRGQEWLIHAFKMHRKVTRDPVTQKMRDGFVTVWRFPD
jgi:hypothetical protein